MSNGGGGAATNSGIDFQQRIAALVLSHMLVDVNNYSALQLGDELNVNEVRFETNNNIDDLVLQTTSGRVLIQAKRSLSLSDSTNSEFSAVLKQFVAQYVDDNANTDTYLLATSSRSSQRITKELRKLTEAARLNETGSTDNPLTKAEEEVLGKTRGVIQAHYLDKTGSAITEDSLNCLFKRIRVALIDIEEGTSLEAAVLILLAGKANISPQLLWSSLIALCVSLAKDRLSIDNDGLIQRIGKYIGNTDTDSASKATFDFLRVQCQEPFSAGREVLLVKSFLEDADYLILELYRFEDDGRKRSKFFDNKVELLNGLTCEVIYRAATFAGIERFIEERANHFSQAKVAIIPINTEENVEEQPYAMAHASHCSYLAESSDNPLQCLHCGDAISEDLAQFIEIDEEQQEHTVGLIHSRCLRPIDRVLGVIHSDLFRENKLLSNFDYTTWFLEAPRGQGLFGAMSHLGNSIYPVAWKPDYNQVSKGLWCVKINLDDGSARYVHERRRVIRYSENEAINTAMEFDESFKRARNDKDPWCYTTENEGFTTYSVALKVMTEEERCLLCVNAEAVNYTRSIGNAYSKFDNFYAPLAILIERSTGLPVSISDAVFLISNPMLLEKYIENWRRAGIELPDFDVSIIESDDKFDKFASQVKSDGRTLIVNPMLTMSGELSSGCVIENYYELVNVETEKEWNGMRNAGRNAGRP